MSRLQKDFARSVREADSPRELFSDALACAYHFPDGDMPGILAAFAGVAEFVFSDKTRTASIGWNNGSVRLSVNRDFILKYACDPQSFLFVVCHELLHKTTGDLFRINISRREHAADNLAADLLINDYLISCVFQKPLSIVNKLYAASPLPYRLLAHHTSIDENELLAGERDAAVRKSAAAIFNIIKEGLSASHGCVYEMVSELFLLKYGREPAPAEITVILIGSHGEKDDSPLKDFLRKLLGTDLSGGHGFGYEEFRDIVNVSPKESRELREIITRALEPDVKNPVVKQILMPEYGVLPAFSRRDCFFMASGFTPVFYRNQCLGTGRDENRVRVYFDVSGSTKKWWPVIYGILVGAKDLMGDEVYAFSNKVFTVTMKEVEKGLVRTTCGTDIDCLAAHAAKNGFRRILIITDGDMGFPSVSTREIFSTLDVYVIFTRYNIPYPFAESVGGRNGLNKKYWILPQYFKEDD